MPGKEMKLDPEMMERVSTRVSVLEQLWHLQVSRPGKLLLIRPRVPGDAYTEIGSNNWAADVKQKALDEGWTVHDLHANDATRQKIEDAINADHPDLIIHYDHGSNMTMWGQKNNALEAGLDDSNIALASGRIVSTVSCLSAAGLGPTGIGVGVTAYMGYTDLHSFWTGYEDDFGEAANAANYALLECKTMQEAFDEGWAAYDQLYGDLLALGGFAANFVAPTALHDRDCFALLGSTSAVACPAGLLCRPGLPGTEIHCVRGGPDMAVVHCRVGQPDMAMELCHAAPDLLLCGHGPDMCAAGPPLIVREVLTDYPYDLVIVDMDKVPPRMQKSFRQMIEQMRLER